MEIHVGLRSSHLILINKLLISLKEKNNISKEKVTRNNNSKITILLKKSQSNQNKIKSQNIKKVAVRKK